MPKTVESSDIVKLREKLRAGSLESNFFVSLLGLKTYEALKLAKKVEEGLSYSALERFQRNAALTTSQVCDLVGIRKRTLSRRKESGRLEPAESDRLLRASRILGKALEFFEGDAEGARQWLSSSQPALAGNRPIDIAKSDVGAREVERLIGRLEHGIPS